MTSKFIRPKILCVLLLAAVAPLIAGCQMDSRQQVLASSNTQAAQRAISTRSFDTGDQGRVFQATIAALQDLGFVVDRADRGKIAVDRCQHLSLRCIRDRASQQLVESQLFYLIKLRF